ncbi:N-acetylmuramoyl-L-alanine amidase [Salibacteraceae bacterium]|nr:N-acetylmuramoyl-L-alanine amidase [Salibacteraceae bacterium]MDB9709473.1 N-acetylmuramoyl-L-alanine amidase [Salibacteraceae bacterium]MDC1303994.1 N-acetylmuramoyl-L-alanine amidase [Salibacteraceae bacterium]
MQVNQPLSRWRLRTLLTFGATAFVLMVFSSFVPNHRGTKIAEMGVLKVVIDAGHGGHDPGNTGTGRYKKSEKDISLEVALQLGEYIERAYENVDVIYTRKEDKFVTLKGRTTIANKADADLFLSIHCNSAANKEAFGTETFVMSMTKIAANLELAKRENSSILLEENYEQTYEGFNPDSPESLIARSIAQSVYLDQSLTLSAHIQEQYRERVSRRDRGVKQAPYWVISFTTMPSVLTELGFLTNKGEEDFLNSDNGKVYMASAIYRAFKQYKAEIEGVEISTLDFEKNIPEVTDEAPIVEVKKDEKPTTKPDVKQENLVVKEKAKSENIEPVFYKIQLMASSNPIDLKPENFNGLEEVKSYEVEGLYKYTIGEVTDYKKAVSLQRTVRENAYPKAFITAFYNGERIGLSKALEISRAINTTD